MTRVMTYRIPRWCRVGLHDWREVQEPHSTTWYVRCRRCPAWRRR